MPLKYRSPSYTQKQTYGNQRIVFSPKLLRDVALYSDLEFDHYVLLEGTPDITGFCEQPCLATAVINGESIATCLDAWVLWRDGREQFREVKNAADIKGLDRTAPAWSKIEAARRWSELHGGSFALMTEEHIHQDPTWLANWKEILPYLHDVRDVRNEGLDLSLLAYLERSGPISLAECEERFLSVEPTTVHRAAFLLLHKGQVVADLSRAPISRDLRLAVAERTP